MNDDKMKTNEEAKLMSNAKTTVLMNDERCKDASTLMPVLTKLNEDAKLTRDAKMSVLMSY